MGYKFDEKWSKALQSLYGSVVNDERYTDFLDQAHNLVGTSFLVSGMFDPFDRENVHSFYAPQNIGVSGAAEYLALAAKTHVDGMRDMMRAKPQTVILDVDIYSDRESLKSIPTMKLLREKYQATHIGSVNAQPNNAWVDYVMFAYKPSEFVQAEHVRSGIGYFVPHIGVASEVRRAFKQLEKRYNAVFTALDALRYGVALIGENKEVLICNSAFNRILDNGDGLRMTADKILAVRDEASNVLFQSALSETLIAARGENNAFRQTIPVDRSEGKTPYILDFAPFFDDLGGELNLKIEGALLFMINPEIPALLSHHGLSAAFSFTPAESAVCRQVLDGYSNGDIADANNVTLPTVKSQVSSIYSKTRVTDRSGLMRLASKVTPPLEGTE